MRVTTDGIELEADAWHAELVVKELGLENSKTTAVPGSKEEAKKVPASTSTVPTGMEKATTKARLDIERGIDSIQSARQSAKSDQWDIEQASEVAIDGDEFDEDLNAAEARLYRGVAARLNYMSPDRPDIGYAVKEAARSMSAPKASDLRRLRKIGKYLLGQPRLVSLFKWQDMPTRITTFTDSDWAGCARTAKSTSGGAVCIGEHVIKTYCKQQKVIALSSAEAELYAMVAASAETLALAVYARDLGLDMECELYCDSSAALGISQRAGIGKVRHLRTQGLWVQEVRISGRIQYKKVLGEKNPADLLTKHMSADLAGRHLATLNMRLSTGRATTAPTLDSLVKGWYHDIGSLSTEGRIDERRVRFNSKVTYRPIPAEGRGRKTPARGTRPVCRGGQSLDLLEEPKNIDSDEGIHDRVEECKCGGQRRSKGARWADMAEGSDEDTECVACARSWFGPGVDERDYFSAGVPAIAEEVVQSQSGNLCLNSFVKSHSGKCILVLGRTGWLSDGHLEAGRAVPSVGRLNSLSIGVSSCHNRESADSAPRRRCRRSVGRGPNPIGSGALYTRTTRHSHV